MVNIALGTTPTILINLDKVDPKTFVVADLTVKNRNGIIITRNIDTASIEDSQISWKLTQKETLKLTTAASYKVMCNWVTTDGTRGITKETDLRVIDNHENWELYPSDVDPDEDITIQTDPLNVDAYATPQMYGAKADDYTDDSAAIQAAIDSGKSVYLPRGKYKIDSPLVIDGKDYWSFNAQDAIITYTGTDYAVQILNAHQINVHLGMIYAISGGGVGFFARNENEWNQYDVLTFKGIFADTDCIHIETADEGWSNENLVFGGQFSRGQNGVHMLRTSGTHGLNGWKFINCGVEGVTNGFLFEAGNEEICNNTILFPRYSESFDTLLKTVGTVCDCTLIASTAISPSFIVASPETTRFIIDAPIGDYWHIEDTAYVRGVIINGKLMGERPTLIEVTS